MQCYSFPLPSPTSMIASFASYCPQCWDSMELDLDLGLEVSYVGIEQSLALIYIADAVDFAHNRRLHVGSQETVQLPLSLPLFLSRPGSKGLRGQRWNCSAVHDVARL